MRAQKSSSRFYLGVKSWVLDYGYEQEIVWQESQLPQQVNESEFLREAAWVIYCSGFREATVRSHFDFISLCFFDWSSASEIAAARKQCIDSAMHAIGNRRKHEAIMTIAEHIAAISYPAFHERFLRRPIEVFQELPFLGPVTSVHLAKNLGFDVAKPDRHLVTLQKRLGFSDVTEMCRTFSEQSGDPVKVVDLVLWRFMERGVHHSISETLICEYL